jgi:hypothetical protein
MRRHPLRIGLAEHNSTAGLLAVQGVPPGVIMPLMEGLEALALGWAAYESAVIADTTDDNWQEHHPYLYHVARHPGLTRQRAFEVMAKASVEAILAEYYASVGAAPAPVAPAA